MQIISDSFLLSDLKKIAKTRFGNFVKAVVDIEKEIMAIDADLHADEEALLLANGSQQKDVWGINIYVDETDAKFIEFDSMINLRPSQDNLSRGIDNENIRNRIITIVHRLIKK